MKRIIYFSLMLGLLAATSCVDDDKLFELSDFPEGAVPNFTQTANDDGFIGLGQAADFTMEVNVDFANNLQPGADGKTQGSGRVSPNLEWAEVQTLDIEVMWTDVSTGNSYTGIVGSTDTWPVTLTYTGMDIVNAIPELSSPDSLTLGDIVTVAGGIHFADGRVAPAFVPSNTGQPILAYSASFFGQPGLTHTIQYSVNCVSSLGVEVNYELLQVVDGNGTNLPLGTGTFTWVANSNGNYSWPNYTFGVYQSAFGCCEQGAASALRVTDLCDDLAITDDAYGCGWAIAVDEVSGADLTVTLTGGCIGLIQLKMTRTDGQDWPALF